MADIISLASYRPDPNAPDADCIVKDGQGRDMFSFALSFQHEGAEWALNIWAYDLQDAEARVNSIRSNLTVLGQAVSMVPA